MPKREYLRILGLIWLVGGIAAQNDSVMWMCIGMSLLMLVAIVLTPQDERL